MDSYSSILDENKNKNRSDPSRMNNIDLARLRPEKFDDVSVKEQILLIQQTCKDVDPEIIALVFHECDHNMQNTIARIRAGDFEDGGWQTAKPNNKKKTHHNNRHPGDQIINGGTLSDSERSLSQRTSPASSLRGGHRRNDQYQYPSSTRADAQRRGNDAGRNQFNSRYSARANPTNKPVLSSKTTITTSSSQPIPSETSLPTKQSNEELSRIVSPLTDDYVFVNGPTQPLSFDNSQKTTTILSSSKRPIISSIPQEPVSMHPTVQFPTEPIDIQFGDVQWNDSGPVAVSPPNDTPGSTILDNHVTENQDMQDALPSNFINHQPTNEIDNQFSSSLSILDNTISNNLPIVSPEGTSHLSDHLTDTSSSIPTQYSSQQQGLIPIPITRLPPTSTPRAPEYTSPTSQLIPNNFQQNNTNATSSAFTPFNPAGNYSSIPKEYSQTTAWNPPSSNYKTASKTTMIPAGTYQQQPSYQLPPQQQQQQQPQIFFETYPYHTLSPPVLQVFAPIEHWPPNGYSTQLESYPYPTANYIPTYSNQQQYHPSTKYDQQAYDKEFFAYYGQTRSSNNDISYQQQSSTPSQSTKDTHTTSKLSPTAATFSQGAPLTASPSAPALYLNPVPFSMLNYFPSMGGMTQQDRTVSYSSIDNNRDNRNGALYSGTNNRTNYYHHGQAQQQRTHNNNVSNSTWHSQH